MDEIQLSNLLIILAACALGLGIAVYVYWSIDKKL